MISFIEKFLAMVCVAQILAFVFALTITIRPSDYSFGLCKNYPEYRYDYLIPGYKIGCELGIYLSRETNHLHRGYQAFP